MTNRAEKFLREVQAALDTPVHVAEGPIEHNRPMNPQSRVFDETAPYSPRTHSTAAFRDMPVGGKFGWTWNREGTKKIKVWIPTGDVR